MVDNRYDSVFQLSKRNFIGMALYSRNMNTLKVLNLSLYCLFVQIFYAYEVSGSNCADRNLIPLKKFLKIG